MTRHPSVPANQTGWIHLGATSTDTAMLAIVAPEMAGILGDEWTARYVGEDGEELPAPAVPPEHDLAEFEEVQVGDDASAVLFATHADGAYLIQGRFAESYGGVRELLEVRIRLWSCECTCHDSQLPEMNTCDGDCHDDDVA